MNKVKQRQFLFVMIMVFTLASSGLASAVTTEGTQGSFSCGVANCLWSKGDRLTIQIPPNAFPKDMVVRIVKKDAANLEVPAGYYVDRAIDITFTSTFSIFETNSMVPLRLIFDFDIIDYKRACDMDTSQPLGKFRIAGYNKTMHKWEVLPTTIYWDGQVGKAEASGNMGSGIYALFWDPDAEGSSLSSMGNDKLRLFVNYLPVYSEVEPFIYGGRTMVPIGILSKNLGAQVTWYSDDKRAEILSAPHKVEIWVGNSQGLKDGQVVTMQVPPMITGSRTFVPLGFISQALGADVDWDGLCRTVYVVQS